MFDILLQVLDGGRVTDLQGRTVNFSNTVTSNAESQFDLEISDREGAVKRW